jgi:hypothetical protein
MDQHGGCSATGASVDSQHDVGVKHGDERVEIGPRAARRKALTTAR